MFSSVDKVVSRVLDFWVLKLGFSAIPRFEVLSSIIVKISFFSFGDLQFIITVPGFPGSATVVQ